jgi:hypothetical protein
VRALARPRTVASSIALLMVLASVLPGAAAGSGSTSDLDLRGRVLTGDSASFVRAASVELLVYEGPRLPANLRSYQLTVSADDGAFNFTVPAPDWGGGYNATLRAYYPAVGATASVEFALSAMMEQTRDVVLPWNRTLGARVGVDPPRIQTPRDAQANFVVNVTNAGNDTDAVLLWAVPQDAGVSASFSPRNRSELEPGRWQLLALVAEGAGLPEGSYNVSLRWRSEWFPGEAGRVDLVWDVRPEVKLSVAPSGVSWWPDPLYGGDHGLLNCTVANRGRDGAPGANVTVELSHPTGGQVLRDRVRLDVPALGCATASFFWTAVYSTVPYGLTFTVEHPLDIDTDDNAVSVQLPVGVHNTPPTVRFTSPVNGTHLAGSVTIRLSVTDPDAAYPATAVYLRLDQGEWMPMSISSPVYVWDTTKGKDGWHTLEAYATDAYSGSTIASIVVKVENGGPNTSPEVYIEAPLEGDVFKDTLWAKGGALDPDGAVTRVEVAIDSGNWTAAQGTEHWTFEAQLIGLAMGLHALRARAFDGIDLSPIIRVNFTTTLTVARGIQLSFAVYPVSALPGDQVELRGEVKYDNGVRAREAVALLSGQGVPAGKDIGCDALGRFVYTMTAPATPGTYTYVANCSARGFTAERTSKLTVLKTTHPDLTVTSMTVTGTPRAVGSNLTVAVEIRNLGSGSGECNLTAWEGEAGRGRPIVDRSLTVYNVLTASFTWVPSRAGNIDLVVELVNVVPEDANLTNNRRTETLTIVEVPDVRALKVVPSNLRPYANATVSISVALENLGGLNATCDVELYVDGRNDTSRVAVAPNVVVPAHGKAYATFTWLPRQGHHELFVLVRNVHPDEARTDNNNITYGIDVVGPFVPPAPKERAFLPGAGAAGAILAVCAVAGLVARRRSGGVRPNGS